MEKNLHKIEQKLEYNSKRNSDIITPCCNKSNKDGKFVNFKHYPEIYGYCHSCGKSSLPPSVYKDSKGNEYIWNEIKKEFKPLNSQLYYINSNVYYKNVLQCNTINEKEEIKKKFIPKNLVLKYLNNYPENNLLVYLRKTYGNDKVEIIKKMYHIGTSKDGGTIFWNINKNNKIQKAKVSYYKNNGKRTNYFKVPYKKEDGYYNCLFGEHLISNPDNTNKPIVLVESEKTALVSAINLPKYIWLSYGGINGLTNDKLKVLIGHKILIVPDMSKNAVEIIKKKIPYLIELGIDAHLWDMTNGATDEQLKKEGLYNCDLEDIFRNISN